MAEGFELVNPGDAFPEDFTTELGEDYSVALYLMDRAKETSKQVSKIVTKANQGNLDNSDIKQAQLLEKRSYHLREAAATYIPIIIESEPQ